MEFELSAEKAIQERNARIRNVLREKIKIREQIAARERKDVADSITYAKRIQQAVLPEIKNMKYHFNDAFVFYSPKDIVSGDFFWFENFGSTSVIVVADCTGHGVPGAFMSMLGVVLLNLIVSEKNITAPDQILYNLHKELRKTLKQYTDDSELPDGMDLSVATIDHHEHQLHFAGGNHSLFLNSDGNTEEIHGDKYGIGGLVRGIDRVFTSHSRKLTKGDKLYFTTDGFKDQFGGEFNKKFSKKKFIALIEEISQLPFVYHELFISETFDGWKKNLAHTDDVLVLGIEY
jgi:serine phosphatase RsbU (regulator of sigma subunit)